MEQAGLPKIDPTSESVVSNVPPANTDSGLKTKIRRLFSGFSAKRYSSLGMTVLLLIALPALVLTIVKSRTNYLNRAASGEPSNACIGTNDGVVCSVNSCHDCPIGQECTCETIPGICTGGKCIAQTPSPIPTSSCLKGISSWTPGRTCTFKTFVPSDETGLYSAQYQCYGSSESYTATLNRCAASSELTTIAQQFCASLNCATPSAQPTCIPRPTPYCSTDKFGNYTCQDFSMPKEGYCTPAPYPIPSPIPTRSPVSTPSQIPTTIPTRSPVPIPSPIKSTVPTSSPISIKPPIISTRTLPVGYAGKLYSASVSGYDSNLNTMLNMTITNLPRGLSMSSCAVSQRGSGSAITCYIQGRPTTWGIKLVRVNLTNSYGGTTSRTLPFIVYPSFLRRLPAANPYR